MAAPGILADGLAPPPLGSRANGKKASGAVVALSLSNPSAFQSFLWKADARPGCTAVFGGAGTTPVFPYSTTLTVTGKGTFRVTGTGNNNARGDEQSVAALWVPSGALLLRKPLVAEEAEFDSTSSWDDSLADTIDAVGRLGPYTELAFTTDADKTASAGALEARTIIVAGVGVLTAVRNYTLSPTGIKDPLFLVVNNTLGGQQLRVIDGLGGTSATLAAGAAKWVLWTSAGYQAV